MEIHPFTYYMKAFFAYLIALILDNFTSILEQYGQMLFIAISAMVIDFITGILSAKINRLVDREKSWIGFWKKLAYLFAMCFAIFIDFSLPIVAAKTGYDFAIVAPIGIFVIGYVYVNESISIIINLEHCGIRLPKALIRGFKNIRS